MKLLFVHDHPFFTLNNTVFSGGGLPATTWTNYLMNFDNIIVFGRNSNSLKDKKIISSGSENVKFNLTKNYSSFIKLLLNHKKIINELSKLIAEADIVLVRLPSVLGIITAFLAFKLNKKIWVEIVGNADEAMMSHGSIKGKILAPIFHKLMKYVVGKAIYTTYVTENKLQKDYPHNKNSITVSISNVIIKTALEESQIDSLRFTSNHLKIALIGGFDARYKGQDILLKAIGLLPEHIKNNIQLYFVGVGDFKWVTSLANELNLQSCIKFIGSKESGSPIFELLKEMSLYIQPSFTEGMPRALLEAMSMGCPVMGSIVGGIPDVVSKDLLHQKGDYKTIAKQIERLYFNREILKKESFRSIRVVRPYLKNNLDAKRKIFYKQMNKDIDNS